MFNDLLGLSAMLVAVATLALLLAGRLPLPGPILRAIVLVASTVVAGLLAGRVDLLALRPAVPSLTDPLTQVGLAVLVAALLTPWKWWAVGSVAFASLVVATALYLIYLVGVTIVLSVSPLSLALGILLLVFQAIALALMLASVFEMVDALCRPVEIPPRPAPPASWPSVAFQIPVHSEPPELVIATIHSLVALDYPRDRLVIQVLDNNTTDESLWRPLEDECDRLATAGYRVEFSHLEDWPGYKAGALNYGTAHLPKDVEILVIVDADYIVAPAFLRETVSYFNDPAVAFVQTPQEYREWQSSGFYRACHTAFAYFFKVGMLSRSYRNSIIFAGTMGLIRRKALDEIGGWDEAIITEDAEASLRILAHGHRAVYVPVAYGRGIMPLTYEGLRSQRFRWAFGGMQILRKHWRSLTPWARSGLTQRQRRDYLLGGLGWFNDALTLGFAAFIGATAVGYLTGHPFVVQRLQGLGLVLPILYIGLGLVRYLWGLRVATGASGAEAAAAMRINLSLAWIVTLALIRGAVERQGVFLRTPKFQGSPTVRSLRLVWAELLLAVVSGVLAVALLIAAGLSGLALTVGTLLAWTAIVFGSAVDFALGDPSRPPEALREKAALETAGAAVTRAARRAPALGGLAAGLTVLLAVVFVLATEAVHPPVQGAGSALPPGPIAHGPAPTAVPAAVPSVALPVPVPSASSAPTPAPAATSTPAPASPTPAPPSPTPAPSTPPSAAPTAAPSPLPSGT